jgi:cytochrome c-type biogenesis protein CcmE
VTDVPTAVGPPADPGPAPDPGPARDPQAPMGRRTAPGPAPAGTSSRRARLRLGLVGVVLAGAFVALVVKGLGGSLNYFETVDQAVADRATLGGHTFRLEGLVVPGTVVRHGSTVRFVAAGTVHRVAVVNSGNPPQLFQPDVPVVVVGHFVGSVFVSSQIIVDHTAQYIEQFPNRVRAPNGTSR